MQASIDNSLRSEYEIVIEDIDKLMACVMTVLIRVNERFSIA